MTVSIPPSAGADLVDQLARLAPDSPIHLVRHRREKVALATQGGYDALFDADLPGLSLLERLLVALYACRLTPALALAAHYRERAVAAGADGAVLAAVESGDPQGLADTRLRAMLAFTRILILSPIEGDRALLNTLPAAGISTPAIVTLAQLIAFLSYQTRLVAGLSAMRAARETSSPEAAR